MNRRSFLRTSAVLASGLAALAASLSPLRDLGDYTTLDRFVQKYYKELTPEEMAKVLKRIEAEVERQYGIRPHVRDLKPMDGVEFVYALNLTRCIGCRKCVHACVQENNQSRTPEIQYIRVLRLPHGSLDIDNAEHNYAPESVPEKRLLLHAGAVPAVQEPALRQGLSCARHLAGDGWHHGHRLRLVHRLPLLRSRLSVLGSTVQLHQAVDSQGPVESGHGLPRQTARGARA